MPQTLGNVVKRGDRATAGDTQGEAFRNTPVLGRLEAMAASLVKTSLVVLIRRGEEVLRQDFCGQAASLPGFCTLMRSAPHGDRQCLTCRRLITLSAQYRGLTTYTCHGGIRVVAAPVPGSDGGPAPSLVVASSAFAHPDQDKGWKAVRAQAHGLQMDLKVLRKLYYMLPVLSESSQETLQAIVDVAAVALAEAAAPVRRHQEVAPYRDKSSDRSSPLIAAELQQALTLSRTESFEGPGRGTGTVLTELVTAMVARDPSLPFTVANVARAACMTPNYFSALFHKHTGKSFMAFLSGQRVEKAKSLLRDPSLNLQDIAERAGFQDAAYFSRRFKQLTGLSPSAWRNRLAQAP
ncbi:MAG: helix-turn-helix domain-containing protein [Candidatus Hydrogenedentes bacterium]|nr:helix-turn-helix domain-containing protein [Candidatus Hydrogenedentota bacterium]